MDWQGWIQVDNTLQPDTFFHVADGSELDGGTFGSLLPLEGSKSMWCGAYPDGSDPYLCSWIAAPGYGSNWDQVLISDQMILAPPISLSYLGFFDSEENDQTKIYYDQGGLDWVELAEFDGTQYVDTTHTIDPLAWSRMVLYTGTDDLLIDKATGGGYLFKTKFKIHFKSDGGWNDQDGLWDTDGACLLDDITISDQNGIYDHEDFESAAAGDKRCGIWNADLGQVPYGIYSGLHSNLIDLDPCANNYGTQIVFFIGSAYPAPSYPNPGMFTTPFCYGPGAKEYPCQDEMVVSPPIALDRYSTNNDEVQDGVIPGGELGGLNGYLLRFDVYRDLPVINCVYYYWHVRTIEDGCPGPWQDGGSLYHGDYQDYYEFVQDISSYLGPTVDAIQVAVGVVDMCDTWYMLYCTCAEHTPAPYFDNIRVQRYQDTGPKWRYYAQNLFQDNFPMFAFDLESWVRADVANDLKSSSNPQYLAGDSATVIVTSPYGGGIRYSGEYPNEVYDVFMYVRCSYIGDPGSPKPPLYGPSLEGNVGEYVSDDGSSWTCFRGKTYLYGYDWYSFDLNDSLLTRGYLVEYYFKAYDFDNESTTLPDRAEEEGIYFEFTCLPTLASDILYVDDYHGIGVSGGDVEVYFDQAFKAVLPAGNQPDRYDVNAPTGGHGNGLASRATPYHLETAYQKIIWDSGDLDNLTITDGSSTSGKADDCTLLNDWLDYSPHDCGLWILGDNVALDLSNNLGASAIALMSKCGISHVGDSYFNLSGNIIPDVRGSSPGIFYHAGTPDTLYLFGGCPGLNNFDLLEKAGSGQYALRYPDHLVLPYYAGIQSTGINYGGYDVKTMWFGFSLMYIRDMENGAPLVRNKLVKAVIDWFDNDTNPDITGDETPVVYRYSLAQNYPNPFNPVTTVKFILRRKGPATLKIYNIAGQLVNTLVDGTLDRGPHEIVWEGKNREGARVASGVYFYRLVAGDFEQTRKMVLLR
ncbi:MAG: T9SS type A sorting domain-containing protein [Candidatus Krumholzibacteriota bacterium]|nr:T9SS type A sorting domain-containing protein [Candidatus Krumholzibacteriota bacterium]